MPACFELAGWRSWLICLYSEKQVSLPLIWDEPKTKHVKTTDRLRKPYNMVIHKPYPIFLCWNIYQCERRISAGSLQLVEIKISHWQFPNNFAPWNWSESRSERTPFSFLTFPVSRPFSHPTLHNTKAHKFQGCRERVSKQLPAFVKAAVSLVLNGLWHLLMMAKDQCIHTRFG